MVRLDINIAQDGQELLVEVTAPGADVVGFEHAPETAEQKRSVWTSYRGATKQAKRAI